MVQRLALVVVNCKDVNVVLDMLLIGALLIQLVDQNYLVRFLG